jgi:uncharacterized protein DUF5666
MNAIRITIILCGTFLLTVLSACGGGSSGAISSPPPPPIGGIGRNGIAVGPISTFSSVVVNGVTYDTAAATFTVNDVAGTQSDLRVGQIVSIKGSIDDNGTTGTADEVTFDGTVKGPVESIDLAANRLVVLGQTVLVSPDTSFDNSFSPASLEGVSVAQIVEVSGQFDANGNIIATRIEPKVAGTPFEVHGTVASLDTVNMRFNLNALVVDYSNAMLDNFAGGQIADGDFVEAKGLSLGGAGELLATQVELEAFLPDGAAGDHVEIEGFITRFASAQDFDVAGVPVTTNANTTFVGGVAADLSLNVKVEAEGELDANDVIVATKIDIRRSKAVRVVANADSVDAANNSVVVLGITVTLDDLTRIEDKSNADVDPLTLSDVNAGDYLEIRGSEFPAGGGTILATIFEREDPDTEAIMQGFVVSVSDPSFEILGVTVSTNGGTIFRDANDGIISATDFFNQVAPNSLVKAKGTEVSDTAITATEVEFELEF